MRTANPRRYAPELEQLLYVKKDYTLARVVVGGIVLFLACLLATSGGPR